MENHTDLQALADRAENHANLLETAAALLEADGFGLDPEQGQVRHLRRMAGALRAQAAIGKRAQSYTSGPYLPGPMAAPEAARRLWH